MTRRGLTVVELMNFLGLAAILGAAGMYAVARYVRHSKTLEATSSVTSIAGAAASYYNESDRNQPAGASAEAVRAMRRFPPSSRDPVPKEPTDVRGQKYASNRADWAQTPWPELRFSILTPQCYQYSFESEGAGATAKATITATGDLDGDGVRSTFQLTVQPDEQFNAHVAPQMSKVEPEE